MKNPEEMQNLLGIALSESFEVSVNNQRAEECHEQAVSHEILGKTLQQYSIISELGRGGMGIVYKAFDNRLNREVALKVLPATDSFEKLLQEAKSVAQLNHPNIIHLYEICNSPCFFAMELIHGVSLHQFISIVQNSRGKSTLEK